MTTVNIYLVFNGECEAAFNFYKSVFGGEFSYFSRFSSMPEDHKKEIRETCLNRVLHVSLPVSNETMLMGCDSGSYSDQTNAGNNFSISVTPENRLEADRIFMGLSEGGEVQMPMHDTYWGDYFGKLKDKFGINWMVNFETNRSPENK